MTIKLGVVMDPISAINYKKDSTLAMLWEAKKRGYEIYYYELADLYLQDGRAHGDAKHLDVFQNPEHWFEFRGEATFPLAELNVILMRKDPPLDAEYIHATQLLAFAEREGTLVVNHSQALRDCNEKLFAAEFSTCIPPTLVTQSRTHFLAFLQTYQDIVCKPLNAMGGESVFRLRGADVNSNVVFDTITNHGHTQMMVQKFIPEIVQGDKRILMIDGKPLPYLLARVPQQGDWRGNLAVGAVGEVRPLSPRDKAIAELVGPVLQERQIYFAGLDIIGDYLTEINLTSPTCIREIEAGSDVPVTALLFDCIEKHL